MPGDDFKRVRDMLTRASQSSCITSLQGRRVQHWCERLRAVAAGDGISPEDEDQLRRVLAKDLLCGDTPELVPGLWHELEAEAALEALIEQVEAASEIFETDQGRVLAFVIPYAVRLTSLTERRWRVPLTDQARRWPLHLAIRRRVGAVDCVIDPHMYDGPMLAALGPKDVRRHVMSLLTTPQDPSRLHPPLFEPMVLHALPEPQWNVVYSVGAALHASGARLLMREAPAAWLADLHFSSEISLPLMIEKLMSSKISLEVKCQGIRPWHEGLRLGSEALRRYRFGQQQWTGDSSRHMSTAGDAQRLRELIASRDKRRPESPA